MPLPRLRIVTGKGGVGKTTVATTLALAEARAGRRVLLAEANAGDRVTAMIGASPVGFEMREVLENVHVVDINGSDAIREYALLMLKFETVYKAVFENRLVRHFIELVPSLGELVTLGKLWFHDQERVDGRPRFDVIVFDAPATGHAISMLRNPQAVEVTVPPGPLRENARLIREMITNPDHTVLHIVSTPEEMPVNEAVELEQATSDVLGIELGEAFINQRVDALPDGANAALDGLDDSTIADLVDALRRREGKRRAGERHLARLPGRLLQTAVSFPRLINLSQSAEALEPLVELVAPIVEGAP